MRAEVQRALLSVAALAAVLVGALLVLEPFVVPIVWALILGTATWPAYRRLRALLRGWHNLAALAMTSLLLLLVLAPMVGLGFALVHEVGPELERLARWVSSSDPHLPVFFDRIPIVRDGLETMIQKVGDPAQRAAWIRSGLERYEEVAVIGGNVLRVVAQLFFTVFTLFFVYRDGDSLAHEAREILDRVLGGKGMAIIAAVRETVEAVSFGWLLTALAQGLVAMIGYWAAGVRAPVLLGFATGVFAVIPFGATVVWGPVVAILAAQGSWLAALGLALYSMLIVSTIDNFLRPLFISGPSKIPFILVFFGLLGGLAAFGVLGLVLGPVFLAVLLALWRQAKDAVAQGPEDEP